MNSIEKLEQLRADLPTIKQPKNARQYAEEIQQLPTRAERNQALLLVPDDLRHIIRFYVATHFSKRDRKPLPDLFPPLNNRENKT